MWARLFALAYDPFLARAEKLGVARERATLLRDARGDVLEIGAGTGLNLAHYPSGVAVTFTEPDPHMAKRLRRKGVQVVEAPAESLPFPDGSFDTVVSTLVLCTVADVAASLREIARVLRPGGQLLFLEHVRAERGSRLERRQDRLHGVWKAFACGCHCNRDLLSLLAANGYRVPRVEHRAWSFVPSVVRPVVTGVAQPV